MNKISSKGWILAISGGFGLGMILGSEFHSAWTNYIGIGIMIGAIILITLTNFLSK